MSSIPRQTPNISNSIDTCCGLVTGSNRLDFISATRGERVGLVVRFLGGGDCGEGGGSARGFAANSSVSYMADHFVTLNAIAAVEGGHLQALPHEEFPTGFDMGSKAGSAGNPDFGSNPLWAFLRIPVVVGQCHGEIWSR